MVHRLAGLVVMAAAAWGAVVLFLCGVQLAGETVAWVANGGFGRLPGWAWPLIAAGVLSLVGVAWFRWLWPDEVGEEIDRRGEEPGAAAEGREQGDNTVRACDDAALRAAVAQERGVAAMAEFLDATTKEREGRGGA